VIQALGETGSERVVDPLIRNFQSDTGQAQAERYHTALALGQIGAPQAAAVLTQGFYGRHPVRHAAGRAIRQIGEKHAGVVQPIVDQLLEDLFSAPDAKRRFQVVDILSHIRPESAVPRLVKAMEDPENSPKQRLAAVEALQAIGDRRASAPLLELFATTQNDTLRGQAAQALVDIRDDEAIPRLIDLLKHEAWKVRWLTAMILGRRYVHSAVPHLLPLLEDSRAEVRREAAIALGRLHQAEQISQAVEPLIRAQEDQEPGVRRAALLALDRIRLRDRIRAWDLDQEGQL
jgi:HEAT repeat protein